MLNKWTLYAFLTGMMVAGVAGYFLIPTKIETKEVVKTVEVEKVVHRDIVKHEVKTIQKDGTITIVTDSHDKSKDVYSSKELSTESTKKTINLNSKKLLVFGGINPLHRDEWVAGASYNFLGPIDVGATYQDGVFVTLGLRF